MLRVRPVRHDGHVRAHADIPQRPYMSLISIERLGLLRTYMSLVRLVGSGNDPG